MNKQFDAVVEFNRDILDIQERIIGLQSEDEFNLSICQLEEEITEIKSAYLQKDIVALIDGLIDLEYFLLGIFYKLGLDQEDHHAIFSYVHDANMLKVKGTNNQRLGYEATDAIKPQGWSSPEEMIKYYLDIAKRVQQQGQA